MNQENRAVVAIFDDATRANVNFDSLVAFDQSIPFDAVLAAKNEAGQVEMQREHRAHGAAAKAIHASGKGLAVTLFASLLADSEGEDASSKGPKRLHLPHSQHAQFRQVANAALDNGEALLGVVCAAGEAERFDRLLNEARRVLQLDIEPGA